MRWLTLCLFLGFISCGGNQQPATDANKETPPESAAQKEQKKPALPQVQLKQDFNIGSDPDGILLGANVAIAEHPEGNLYILDPDNFRVLILDNKGALIKEFGNEGQGPGEFQKPQGVSIDPQGHITIMDPTARAIMRFDSEGNYIDAKRLEVNTPQLLGGPWYFENGNVALHLVMLDQQFQVTYNLSIYDAEMKSIKEIYATPSAPLDWNKANEPGFWVDFLKGQFEEVGKGFAAATTVGDQLYFARGTNFDVQIFNADGSSVKNYTIDAKPIPFTDQSRRELYGQIWESMQSDPMLSNNLPKATFERALTEVEEVEVAPRITGLTRAGAGYAVFYNHDYANRTTQVIFYDAAGNAKGQTNFDGPVQFLRGTETHIYASGLDASDNVVINRYSIQGL